MQRKYVKLSDICNITYGEKPDFENRTYEDFMELDGRDSAYPIIGSYYYNDSYNVEKNSIIYKEKTGEVFLTKALSFMPLGFAKIEAHNKSPYIAASSHTDLNISNMYLYYYIKYILLSSQMTNLTIKSLMNSEILILDIGKQKYIERVMNDVNKNMPYLDLNHPNEIMKIEHDDNESDNIMDYIYQFLGTTIEKFIFETSFSYKHEFKKLYEIFMIEEYKDVTNQDAETSFVKQMSIKNKIISIKFCKNKTYVFKPRLDFSEAYYEYIYFYMKYYIKILDKYDGVDDYEKIINWQIKIPERRIVDVVNDDISYIDNKITEIKSKLLKFTQIINFVIQIIKNIILDNYSMNTKMIDLMSGLSMGDEEEFNPKWKRMAVE